MINSDTWVAAVCLAGSVFLYSTLGLIEDDAAATFPRVVIIIMGILSALLLIQSLIMGRAKAENGEKYPIGRFIFLFLLIVVYLYIMEMVGFYLSAFLFFVAVTFTLGRTTLTPKSAGWRVFTSAAFTGVLFLLFKVLLEVQTPRGIIF